MNADHPPMFRLDALAAGDSDEETAKHVAACGSCRRYIESLRAEALPMTDAPEFARTVAARAETRRPVWPWAASALVLAAAILFFVRTGTTPAPVSDTRFKGGIQLAVVREREGHQERTATSLPARSGDRVRIEVGVDVTQPLEAGILGADGTWTLLLAPVELPPGVHYSEEGARFDDDHVEGWVIAGPPQAVEDARKRRVFDKVSMIPIVAETRPSNE